MTNAPTLPCQTLCPRGGQDCYLHDLHADDWFLDPDDPKRERPATRSERSRYVAAQWACQSCPFRQGCEARGLLPENRRHGIWGGLTPDERDQLAAGLADRYEQHQKLVAKMMNQHRPDE